MGTKRQHLKKCEAETDRLFNFYREKDGAVALQLRHWAW